MSNEQEIAEKRRNGTNKGREDVDIANCIVDRAYVKRQQDEENIPFNKFHPSRAGRMT